jgi:hypothetical protein
MSSQIDDLDTGHHVETLLGTLSDNVDEQFVGTYFLPKKVVIPEDTDKLDNLYSF